MNAEEFIDELENNRETNLPANLQDLVDKRETILEIKDELNSYRDVSEINLNKMQLTIYQAEHLYNNIFEFFVNEGQDISITQNYIGLIKAFNDLFGNIIKSRDFLQQQINIKEQFLKTNNDEQEPEQVINTQYILDKIKKSGKRG